MNTIIKQYQYCYNNITSSIILRMKLFEIITLFPQAFPGTLEFSIFKKARGKCWDMRVHDMREFGVGKHKQVDDEVFGGSAGMLIRPDVIDCAMQHIINGRTRSGINNKATNNISASATGSLSERIAGGASNTATSSISTSAQGSVNESITNGSSNTATSSIGVSATSSLNSAASSKSTSTLRKIFLSPRGRVMDQKMVETWANEESDMLLLCGRYEGVDARAIEHFEFEEISIGNYILAGAEVAAMAMMEAIVRKIPGVIGNAESFTHETFVDNEVSEPRYTRPAVWETHDGDSISVPQIILSGDHKKIAEFQKSGRRKVEE